MQIEFSNIGTEDKTLTLALSKSSEGGFKLVDKRQTVFVRFSITEGRVVITTVDKSLESYKDHILEVLYNYLPDIIEKEGAEFEDNEESEEDISPYDPEDITVHQKQFSIKLIEEMIDNGDIDLSPDFQRNFVWNTTQKSRLIESLLLRIPLPIFYFSEDTEGRLSVVDGLQRLTVIKSFMRNEFPLRNLEYLSDGVQGRYYKSVPEKKQLGIEPKYYRWLNMSQFSVNVIDPRSPMNVKYDIFRRINTGGRPLNNQEIRNCLSSPQLRTLLNDMVSAPEFTQATDGGIRSVRMEDKEVALRFLYFYQKYKSQELAQRYQGNMEAALDQATEEFAKIDTETSEIYLSAFISAMKNAKYLIGSKYAFRKVTPESIEQGDRRSLLNKALFVVFSVLLADFPYQQIEENNAEGSLLEPIAQLLKSDAKLWDYLSYGTNGKANLLYAFSKFKQLISDVIII